jgi:hypothetical protein
MIHSKPQETNEIAARQSHNQANVTTDFPEMEFLFVLFVFFVVKEFSMRLPFADVRPPTSDL